MKGRRVSLLVAALALGASLAAAQPQASTPPEAAPSPAQAQAQADAAVRRRDADRVLQARAHKTLHDCLAAGSACPKSRKRADEADRRLAADQANVNASVARLKDIQDAQFRDLLSHTQSQRQDDNQAASPGRRGGLRRRRAK